MFLNESKDAGICAFDNWEPIRSCTTSKICPQARRQAGADGRDDRSTCMAVLVLAEIWQQGQGCKGGLASKTLLVSKLESETSKNSPGEISGR